MSDTAATALPSYDELMTSLDGCSSALAGLMDAVRGLFESAATADGYAYAVDRLKAAHDAAVDWCSEESQRHA